VGGEGIGEREHAQQQFIGAVDDRQQGLFRGLAQEGLQRRCTRLWTGFGT
jgi:hypothetical protein